jgi:CBS domain-containing protein
MLVRECLRTAPVTVPPTCSLEEAARLLGSHGVGSLLVTDAGRLIGIVTDRDLAVRGIGEAKAPSSEVAAVMTPDPLTIQGSADVFEAFATFQTASTRRLPVLEERELAGIISVDDLLLRLLSEFGSLLHPVAERVIHPA